MMLDLRSGFDIKKLVDALTVNPEIFMSLIFSLFSRLQYEMQTLKLREHYPLKFHSKCII
jgi:hypothetical protein